MTLAPASAPAIRGASVEAYGVAVVVTAVAVLSQYFVPPLVPALAFLYQYAITGYAIVYGVPIVTFLVLVGTGPLRRWHADMEHSALPALGWYGALSAIGFLVTVALLIAYLALDPSALNYLTRQNPVVTNAESDPWLWIGLSFVIGAIEETIFRGWIFGYWVQRASGSLWFHAIWTSALFAGLHLYYGTTYLAAAPLIYPQLFLLGLAFALAVRSSRGNLVWVALLHGATDAISFYSIVSPTGSEILHYGLIGIGAVVALILYFGNRAPAPPPVYSPASGSPGVPMWSYGPDGRPPMAIPYLPPPASPPAPPPSAPSPPEPRPPPPGPPV
jgi:membrane protease YdiL (CAAX protease family)